MGPQPKSAATALLLLSTAVLLGLAAGSPAWGCSVIWVVDPPTNYELVREAQVIVLAKAVAAKRSSGENHHPWGGTVQFEVEEVLKGDFRPSAVTLDGTLGFGGRGPEDDFSRARPGAYSGGCLAHDYRLNQHYVLFLAWSGLDERWSVTGPAFSRVNEEVDVPDSPWLKTVRHYLRAAALNDYDQEKLALRELRAKAAAGESPKDFPKALAKDVDLHFQTPSAAKSWADLIGLYEHAESGEARLAALKGLAAKAPPAAKAMLRGQLLKETRPEWLGPLGDYFSVVPDREILAPLAQSWDRLLANSWPRQSLLRALAKAAGPADAPLMTELLRKAADDDQASVLAQWLTAQGIDTRIAVRSSRPGGRSGSGCSSRPTYSRRGNPRRWDRLDDVLRSQSTNASFLAELKTSFFYLRRDSVDDDKAAANRLYERTRELIAALPSRQP